jgi:uncharacterized membrane protein YjjB (DUF3815 family)
MMTLKMIILAFLGSACPVLLFNIDRKKIVYTGISGVLGWIVYSIVWERTGDPIMGSFWGAFTINIYSELMARFLKTPASMFYIPGIFPLVPGIVTYQTISSLVAGNYHALQSSGLQVLGIAGAIGFGIMLSSFAIQYLLKFIHRKS